ncbi:hypothetical protein HRI_001613600 [Hibiscus trionum]|uniref:Uncharacterized protein n=1 Tax=Hibiscus trionum TaxID=183268 RepID=A0A9W7LWU6_HIBTR|nr:hypothetical protein HRI_001613600 [Hibiscus trionum]
MKEYGVVESWTKVFTVQSVNPYGPRPRVLGFRKNGGVLLQAVDRELASLDLNSQQMEPRAVEVGEGLIPLRHHYIRCRSYVESLVLLDKAVDVHNGTGP